MLTEAQPDVLIVLNDLLEIHEAVVLDEGDLPELLEELGRPAREITQAVTDLYELGLVEGVAVAEIRYPVHISRVTAQGRQ